MKLSLISLPVIASLSTFAMADNYCNYENERWTILTENVYDGDIPAACGGLWDNLKSHPGCSPIGYVDCGAAENGKLSWTFAPWGPCNRGMVESTWWEETRNNNGPLYCRGGPSS
jgi:hypothetical protein